VRGMAALERGPVTSRQDPAERGPLSDGFVLAPLVEPILKYGGVYVRAEQYFYRISIKILRIRQGKAANVWPSEAASNDGSLVRREARKNVR